MPKEGAQRQKLLLCRKSQASLDWHVKLGDHSVRFALLRQSMALHGPDERWNNLLTEGTIPSSLELPYILKVVRFAHPLDAEIN